MAIYCLGSYGRQILRPDKMEKLLSAAQHIRKACEPIISFSDWQLNVLLYQNTYSQIQIFWIRY